MLCIGIDAGGTRTRLLARLDASAPWTTQAPGVNLQRDGLTVAVRHLGGLLRNVLRRYPGVKAVHVCVGVAGAGRMDDRERLATGLREALDPVPVPSLEVVPDVWIAHEGAFAGEAGLLVLAGTGSIVLAKSEDGTFHRAGGWGRLLGDEGSGFALGRAALRAVADAFDGGPATSLTARLAERHGLDGPEALIRKVYAEKMPPEQCAPDLLAEAERGDPVARRITEHQAHALARRACWLTGRCPTVPPRFALVGGVTDNTYYHTLLTATLRTALPGWTPVAPIATPVEGALHRACRLANTDG